MPTEKNTHVKWQAVIGRSTEDPGRETLAYDARVKEERNYK